MVDEFDLRPDELVVLEKAARTADDADRLDRAVRDAPLQVTGSTGQVRVNPLLGEARATRSLLAALLKQLQLPSDGAECAGRDSTVRAITAARARWSGDGRRGA